MKDRNTEGYTNQMIFLKTLVEMEKTSPVMQTKFSGQGNELLISFYLWREIEGLGNGNDGLFVEAELWDQAASLQSALNDPRYGDGLRIHFPNEVTGDKYWIEDLLTLLSDEMWEQYKTVYESIETNTEKILKQLK